MVDASNLKISSPKRARISTGVWEGFFPYYAGFPVSFAKDLLVSADLPPNAVVLDPWNGSGTTSFAATALGNAAIGVDLNPVMVIVARARLLATSEADTLVPLGQKVVREARQLRRHSVSEPLELWFCQNTARALRRLELSIRSHLLGSLSITPKGARLDRLSGLAAVNYVALFSVARDLTAPFRASNPTWLKAPKVDSERLSIEREQIESMFISKLESMASSMSANVSSSNTIGAAEIRLGDSGDAVVSPNRADFVLTSPPYCTRLDYTAATRIELAFLQPLISGGVEQLRRKMTGSPLAPIDKPTIDSRWGTTCVNFLNDVHSHSSRASSGYYFKTHADYFDKMHKSLLRMATSLKSGGKCAMVVQDSFYKEIHNPLPTILTEMAVGAGLLFERREDFKVRTLASINQASKAYRESVSAIESVIILSKKR